jgi:hypothetical protein
VDSGVQVEGMAEALQALYGMSAQAADLTVALQASTELIREGALERWPVVDRTGKLRRSIGLRIGQKSARVMVQAKYSVYLQYGKRVHHKFILLAPSTAEIVECREILTGHVMEGTEVKGMRRALRRRRSRG